MAKMVLAVSSALLISAAAASYWWFAGQCVVALWPKQEFEAEAWAREAEDNRYLFARKIVESGMLVGLDNEGVVSKLGYPGTIYTEAFGLSQNGNLLYTIRYFENGGCGFSSVASLAITFDSFGNVSSAEILFD